MSVYATVADLSGAGGIALPALARLDNATKEAAIVAASGEADGYLRSRGRLPLISWDATLTRYVVALAVYDLMSNRGFNPGQGADVQIRLRYEDAVAWLRRVGKGEIHPLVVFSTPVSMPGPDVISQRRRGYR